MSDPNCNVNQKATRADFIGRQEESTSHVGSARKRPEIWHNTRCEKSFPAKAVESECNQVVKREQERTKLLWRTPRIESSSLDQVPNTARDKRLRVLALRRGPRTGYQ